MEVEDQEETSPAVILRSSTPQTKPILNCFQDANCFVLRRDRPEMTNRFRQYGETHGHTYTHKETDDANE